MSLAGAGRSGKASVDAEEGGAIMENKLHRRQPITKNQIDRIKDTIYTFSSWVKTMAFPVDDGHKVHVSVCFPHDSCGVLFNHDRFRTLRGYRNMSLNISRINARSPHSCKNIKTENTASGSVTPGHIYPSFVWVYFQLSVAPSQRL
jgi:hypothetical protein